jgi:serine/threonine protein kinase
VSGILKEFQNCQNLKHSSIVKNYDMVQDPGCYYIIMEMCDSDLNKRLLQRKLTNDEIYNIMVETASALRYMQALSKDRLIQMSLTGTSNLKIYS